MTHREFRPELLDESEWPLGDVFGNLRDMERAHALLGVRRRAVGFVEGFTFRHPALSVLDVATGSGWLPRALQRRAAAQGRMFHLLALDRNAQVLAAAGQGSDAPACCRADARRLPFPPRSIDLVLCCMTLHHFNRPEAGLLLREIERVARLGWLVCDLVRSRAMVWATTAATRLLSRNRLTRHDGPVSARRAYSLDELSTLAAEARLGDAKVRRFSLVCGEIRKIREQGTGNRNP